MDAFAAGFFPPGKLAFMTGIRASESLIRYRASVNKLNDNYINASSSPRVSLCKPIFDWEEDDVFKFFYDTGTKYADLYDVQHLVGSRLRVSTPLHAEAAKQIHLLRQMDPVFYNQLIGLFPDAAIQDRYWRELDREAMARKHGASYDTVRAFILGMPDPKRRAAALEKFEQVMVRARKDPASYPPAYLFKWIQGGHTKTLMAIGLHSKGK
jgi:predicted phosphoadenosine phosphosulfate sulfurtransferase